MNSDEPALVPQWLQKGGPPGTSGGHNYSSTSQFASRGRLCSDFKRYPSLSTSLSALTDTCPTAAYRVHMHTCIARFTPSVVLLVDTKSRPKRDAPVIGGRPGSTATRDSTFGRPEREAPRRDRALRDSWQTSPGLGSSSASSYRPAAAGRGSRAPPERLASDNSRSSLDNRDSFGPSTSSSSSNNRGVFRTQSGPPLRDREDFGFGPSGSGYHDSSAFKPNAPRGTAVRGSLEKVSFNHTHIKCIEWFIGLLVVSLGVHVSSQQCAPRDGLHTPCFLLPPV